MNITVFIIVCRSFATEKLLTRSHGCEWFSFHGVESFVVGRERTGLQQRQVLIE
jgi:hypothetical protein